MHELSKMLFWINIHWNILPHMMEWKGVSRQISPDISTWKLSSLSLRLMAKLNICIFRQPRMHKFVKFLPQRVWHLITIIGRKEMYGDSRQNKISHISNYFARYGHKVSFDQLSVLSTILINFKQVIYWSVCTGLVLTELKGLSVGGSCLVSSWAQIDSRRQMFITSTSVILRLSCFSNIRLK